MIKGQGRVNVVINKKLSELYKKQFGKKIGEFDYEHLAKEQIYHPLTLYSFSGCHQFLDQVLSILSFLKNVGIPYRWILISDGSHRPEQLKYFQSFPFVECKVWDKFIDERFKKQILKTPFWQIKKLFAFASIPVDSCTILLDSDILFFEKFIDCFDSIIKKNWYLSDLNPHFDDDYKHSINQNYTNSGYIILNEAIDWEAGLEYVLRRLESNNVISHFTEQTATEIVVQRNHFSFLDPRLFLLELKDHFTLNTSYNHAYLAIRHFVGPIRFRMWIVAKKYAFFLR